MANTSNREKDTTMNVSLTPAEKRYIESQGDPGTDFYWLAVERVMSDRINKALEEQVSA